MPEDTYEAVAEQLEKERKANLDGNDKSVFWKFIRRVRTFIVATGRMSNDSFDDAVGWDNLWRLNIPKLSPRPRGEILEVQKILCQSTTKAILARTPAKVTVCMWGESHFPLWNDFDHSCEGENMFAMLPNDRLLLWINYPWGAKALDVEFVGKRILESCS